MPDKPKKLAETDKTGGVEESEREEKGAQRIELSPSQVVGGGVATLGAAVTASVLGVYGTVVGTAVMSIISTSGAAVVQYYLRRGGDRARDLAGGVLHVRPPSRAVPEEEDGGGAAETGSRAGTVTAAMRQEPSPVPPARSADRFEALESEGSDAGEAARPRRRRWPFLLLSAAAMFIAVMAVITVFELATGRTLADTVRGETAASGPSIFGGQSVDEESSQDDGPEVGEPGSPEGGAESEDGDGGTGQEPGPGGPVATPGPEPGEEEAPGTREGQEEPVLPQEEAPEQEPAPEPGAGAPEEGAP